MALAGPPLLCHPYEIGDNPSLPWGNDAFSTSRSFDTKKLETETLKLLSADRPVIARMETIRRAAIYLEKGGDAERLLSRLACRAMDAEAKGDSPAAAAASVDAANANIEGPEPESEQPSAPAARAACLMA